MPVKRVTRSMCAVNMQRFNIGTLVPYAIPCMRKIMTRHSMHYSSHFERDNGGREPDWDLMDLQWGLQWASVATALPDFLREMYPQIYGDKGTVRVGEVTDYSMLPDDHEEGGAVAPLISDPARLFRQARRLGVTHVFDGQGFTFFEPGNTQYWLHSMVLRDMQFEIHNGLEYPTYKFMKRFSPMVEELVIFGDAGLSPSWRECS